MYIYVPTDLYPVTIPVIRKLLNASGPNQIQFFGKVNVLLLLSKFPSSVIRLKLRNIRVSLIQFYNGLV
jgi:hypothetical protein